MREGTLNPQVYKPAIGFCEASVNNHNMYTTQDARLFDSPRAMQLYLDVPPTDSSVWMDDVYNPSLVPRSYSVPYKNYEGIEGGQIRYYVDKDVAPAFRKQIYNMDGVTRIDMFTTPMGKVEPMFYLQPDQYTHNNVSKDTFARDQLFFRNDIISLQQRGHNKQRFEAIK